MTRLSDLSPEQVRLLAKLDDGFDHIDSVGREIGELEPGDILNVRALAILGLVASDEGRSGEMWVRLTAKGRKVREEGAA